MAGPLPIKCVPGGEVHIGYAYDDTGNVRRVLCGAAKRLSPYDSATGTQADSGHHLPVTCRSCIRAARAREGDDGPLGGLSDDVRALLPEPEGCPECQGPAQTGGLDGATFCLDCGESWDPDPLDGVPEPDATGRTQADAQRTVGGD